MSTHTSFLTLIWPMDSPSEKRHCEPRQSAGGGERQTLKNQLTTQERAAKYE